MNKITKIIIIIGLIGLLLIGIYGIYLKIMSNHLCEEKCKKENSLASQIFPSGDWKLNDICVCYFEDEIKSWRMGR